MFVLKKEFADAIISVGKSRLNITKENITDPFVQSVIAQTKGIQHMFTSTPEPKAVSSRGADKNES